MSTETPGKWTEIPGEETGDAIVAAMAAGGVDYLFFTSGSEIGFYQEAIAKAQTQGRKAPKIITVPHEHASLNAALGYAAVSGKPAATAAHVDVGTQHYGGAVHTAWRSGLPVVITAGAPPVGYPGSLRGARDGGHLWAQQVPDQNGILRQYVKWDHRLDYQDNPGLIVSRALQVARSEPCGPVYLSIPREISLLPLRDASFPTADQLGIAQNPAPRPDGIREVAARLVAARNPFVVVSGSGRNPATVPALVALCELMGLPVVSGAARGYLCFPMTHPLYQRKADLGQADFVLALDAAVPWIPGQNAPPREAFIAAIDMDPIKSRVPTYEFTASTRLIADPLLALQALDAEVRARIAAGDKSRFAARTEHWAEASAATWRDFEREALAKANKHPIDPIFLTYQIGQALDDNCLVFDETLPANRTAHYLHAAQPGAYFVNPGSSGGWSTGAALGAKIAAPERDVVVVTGDGFYTFGVPNAAIWAASHYRAPFMVVIYQNRSYTTGTAGVEQTFSGGYAAKAAYEGGYFDPPIDYAKEAEAAGAYGENVRDPAEIAPALKRGLSQIRAGKPAVISVWLPRLLRED